MEQNLKQRVVGALVLVSLAVIFLPLIFDGQQQRIDTAQYAMPEQPTMSIRSVDFVPLQQEAAQERQRVTEVQEQKQRLDEQAASQQAQDESPAPQEQEQVAVVVPVPVPVDQGVAAHIEQEKQVDAALQAAPPQQTVPLADAWVIQVGAFSSQANATGLAHTLKADGYPAFARPMKTQTGTLYKVYVGPDIRRHRVDQQKIALEQKYKFKTLILKHIP